MEFINVDYFVLFFFFVKMRLRVFGFGSECIYHIHVINRIPSQIPLLFLEIEAF